MKEPEFCKASTGEIIPFSSAPTQWLKEVLSGHASIIPEPGDDVEFAKIWAGKILAERGQ